MNTERWCWPWLVCGMFALVMLALAVPGRAAESPPTALWNATSIAGTQSGSAVAVGADGHPLVAGTSCGPNFACDFRIVKLDGATGTPVVWCSARTPSHRDGSHGKPRSSFDGRFPHDQVRRRDGSGIVERPIRRW